MIRLLRLPVLVVGLLVVAVLVPAAALAAPTVTVSPAAGPPTAAVTLTGTGFGATEAVDVFADTTAVRVAVADANGKVVVATTVPASARPGSFWFTLIGRRTGTAAQVAYTVRVDSPQPGFSATRASYNRFENVVTAASARELQTAWSAASTIQGSPTVALSRVFAVDGRGHALAFSASSGAKSWDVAAAAGTGYVSQPTVAGSLVVYKRTDSAIVALNDATGATVWTSAGQADAIVTGVVAAGSVLVVASTTGVVRALTASTGAVRWTVTLPAAAGSPAVSTVAGVVVVPSSNAMYGLSLADGTTSWITSSGGAVGPPAVTASVVAYVSGSNACTADIAGGGQDWCVATGNVPAVAPAIAGNQIFVPTAAGSVLALDLTSGAVRWGSSTKVFAQTPFVAGGLVWTVGAASKYTAFDQDTGAAVASVGANGTSSPVVVNGVLYAPGRTLAVFTLPSATTDHARPDAQVLAASVR